MADRPKLEAEHGVEYIQELGHFYTAVASVFHKLQCDDRTQRYGSTGNPLRTPNRSPPDGGKGRRDRRGNHVCWTQQRHAPTVGAWASAGGGTGCCSSGPGACCGKPARAPTQSPARIVRRRTGIRGRRPGGGVSQGPDWRSEVGALVRGAGGGQGRGGDGRVRQWLGSRGM